MLPEVIFLITVFKVALAQLSENCRKLISFNLPKETKVNIFFFTVSILGQCRALYEYKAAQSDELDLKPGDVITLTAKLEGGWWEGEMGDKSGVFPASYVEEIQ